MSNEEGNKAIVQFLGLKRGWWIHQEPPLTENKRSLCKKLVAEKANIDDFKFARDSYYRYLDRYESAVSLNAPEKRLKVFIEMLEWYNSNKKKA